jgi:hypothetical protein
MVLTPCSSWGPSTSTQTYTTPVVRVCSAGYFVRFACACCSSRLLHFLQSPRIVRQLLLSLDAACVDCAFADDAKQLALNASCHQLTLVSTFIS